MSGTLYNRVVCESHLLAHTISRFVTLLNGQVPASVNVVECARGIICGYVYIWFRSRGGGILFPAIPTTE